MSALLAHVLKEGMSAHKRLYELSALMRKVHESKEHGDAEVVGFEGWIEQDTSKPDGTPRKLLDVSRLGALGWEARIGLEEGLAETYAWYRHERAALTESNVLRATQSSALVG